MKKIKWTKDQIKEFRAWHEKRLAELNYPEEIQRKLRKDREKWISK